MGIDNYNDPIKLYVALEGDNIENTFDLRSFSAILYELSNILDNTYCVLINQKRLNKEMRNEFSINASNIKPGSIHIDIELIINSLQLMAPLIGLANPYTVWQYTVHAYTLLKYLGSKINNDNKPKISINNSNNNTVIYGDNNIIIPDGQILNIAAKTRNNYDIISNYVDEISIKGLKIQSNIQSINELFIDYKDKGLFKTPSFMDDTLFNIDADIIRFDKEKLTGKLFVLENQDIPSKEYSFTVMGEQNREIYIGAMIRKFVTITALTENKLDSINGVIIYKLHIINIVSKE